ncbi:hypothetical protein J4216_04025 [Candidatus Woesearchaeota archaeon]|nr:hypothetical protein [Candidatus Woesearchaeota archaeon]
MVLRSNIYRITYEVKILTEDPTIFTAFGFSYGFDEKEARERFQGDIKDIEDARYRASNLQLDPFKPMVNVNITKIELIAKDNFSSANKGLVERVA